MRETGIVRRIDELGRVVIPKEIRKTQRIRTGDSLEIYTDGNGGVIFKVFAAGRAWRACRRLCGRAGPAAALRRGRL